MENKKYKVDSKLSGIIKIDGASKFYIIDTIQNIVAGQKLIKDFEYIQEKQITEQELQEIKQLIKISQDDYIEILENIIPVEKKESIKNKIKTISFCEDGTIFLFVLNEEFNSKEQLLKFICPNVYKDEKENMYIEIREEA